MGFYEDIAAVLDSEGIESRIHDDVLFVPIAPELEIQFHQVATFGRLSAVTAAQVFVATPEGFDEGWGSDELGYATEHAEGVGDTGSIGDVDEELFDTALVGVVFSPEAALAEVVKHIATDEVVSIINDLLDGADDRVADLGFVQDDTDPMLLVCPVAVDSELEVRLKIIDGRPVAEVLFVSYGSYDSQFNDLVRHAFEDLEGTRDPENSEDTEDTETAEDSGDFGDAGWFARDMIDDIAEMAREVLELGSFTDVDELFNALAVAAVNAEEWEELLKPVGEQTGTMGS